MIRIVRRNAQPRLVTVNVGAFPNDYDKEITVWDDTDTLEIKENWRPKDAVVLYREICLKENAVCLEGEKEDCDSCQRYYAAVDFLAACLKALGEKARE
jgi:hypothetical protein